MGDASGFLHARSVSVLPNTASIGSRAMHPLSYPAAFGNTTGTAHLHKDGISFTYFDHRTNTMQCYEIATIHASMI